MAHSAARLRAVRIGTRGSRLALWQADHVSSLLSAAVPECDVERVVISTKGDRILDTALSKIGDKGLFTQELEGALREGHIDLAVHSLKDLPTDMPQGLGLGAVLEREDPRDAFVSPSGETLADLPHGARVGTSSLRRRAQLLAGRPDLRILDLRGNVPTRIDKVERGDYDAAVLARAGLVRLGLGAKITHALEPEEMLSAVGQGAVAIQVRSGDQRVARLVAHLEHAPTRLATTAERALLARLEGGCQIPIGALATFVGTELTLRGLVASIDGEKLVRASATMPVTERAEAAQLGKRVAEKLLQEGATAILAQVRAALEEGSGPV